MQAARLGRAWARSSRYEVAGPFSCRALACGLVRACAAGPGLGSRALTRRRGRSGAPRVIAAVRRRGLACAALRARACARACVCGRCAACSGRVSPWASRPRACALVRALARVRAGVRPRVRARACARVQACRRGLARVRACVRVASCSRRLGRSWRPAGAPPRSRARAHALGTGAGSLKKARAANENKKYPAGY